MEINELIKVVNYFYPKGITLNDPELFKNNKFKRLSKICLDASNNQDKWKTFLNQLRGQFDIEITEFKMLPKFDPSFCAVFLTEKYEKSKTITYEPLQLILKISIIAPVYSLYFDNFSSNWNKRLIRANPITKKEKVVFDYIEKMLKEFYNDFSPLNSAVSEYLLSHLGDISNTNKRKPYLDECIFGLYLSVHPHNILIDKFEKTSI